MSLLNLLVRTAAREGIRQVGRRSGYGAGYGGGYRRRRGRSLFTYLILGMLAVYGYQHTTAKRGTPLPPTLSGRASYVVDGDTLHLGGFAVRIWGIDAPERDTPDGPRSTQALQNLLRGREITCTPQYWNHDRVVAQCTVQNRDIGGVLVATGWARELISKSNGAYTQHQNAAQNERKGIWRAAL